MGTNQRLNCRFVPLPFRRHDYFCRECPSSPPYWAEFCHEEMGFAHLGRPTDGCDLLIFQSHIGVTAPSPPYWAEFCHEEMGFAHLGRPTDGYDLLIFQSHIGVTAPSPPYWAEFCHEEMGFAHLGRP